MRKYVFSDEAGDFNFSRQPKASKYLIICTIVLDNLDIAKELVKLRECLVWDGICDKDHFHATEDAQVVRNAVYNVIKKHNFRIDSTILEKSKSMPHLRNTNHRFYQYAWFYHFNHVGPLICRPDDELFVAPAAIGTNKERAIYRNCVKDVVTQSLGGVAWRVWFASAKTHPCLQIADYCTWAIQKKWESGDSRSYDLIRDKLATEFELFRMGMTYYY